MGWWMMGSFWSEGVVETDESERSMGWTWLAEPIEWLSCSSDMVDRRGWD